MLAIARQTTASKEALLHYAQKLDKYPLSDVLEAISEFELELRHDFKPAYPTLGDLVERATQMTRKRKRVHVFVSCGRCTKDGKVWVNAKGKPFDAKTGEERFVDDCECRKAWLAAKGFAAK